MALKQVAFDNVNETHFSALIAAGVAENRDIEYKARRTATPMPIMPSSWPTLRLSRTPSVVTCS
jgi:hypothetical protein